MSDVEILERLVSLNAERAAEEARGVIRWLRPEFQKPEGQQALLATREHGRWTSLSAISLSGRQRVNGAIGALLETLSSVPDLLEVPPTH